MEIFPENVIIHNEIQGGDRLNAYYLPSHHGNHMRWLKPNLRSIYGLLGQVPPLPVESESSRVDEIRQAMLDCMSSQGVGERYLHVVRRISYANNAADLWYVRTDLMAILSAEVGETLAQSKLASISKLFSGLLPDSMVLTTSKRPR